MPRQSIGDRPMTDAERQARYRAARKAGAAVIHTRRPADHRSRARRWHDTIAVLLSLQAEYAAWPKFNSGFGKITVPQYVTGSRDGLSTTSLQR